MTEPLTPPDCDLQDFPFMPLHVARLRDSDLASEVEPEAAWYAVLLWAASWHQLPAASLPDNDAVLTKLVGLGRDTKTFKKHRSGALHGFEKCSDGRLYHPVVAEQALNAWNSKLEQRWRTECARIKKANQRNGTSLEMPTLEEFLSRGRPDRVPGDMGGTVPRDVPLKSTSCPEGKGIQETGRGTETGTNIGSPLRSEPDAQALELILAPTLALTVQPIEKPKRPSKAKPENVTAEERAQFDAWWRVYPHKAAKQDAMLAFANVLRFTEVTSAHLAERAQLYGQWLSHTGTIAANGATWLNGRRWEDDLDFSPRQSHQPRGQWSSMDDAIGSMNFEE